MVQIGFKMTSSDQEKLLDKLSAGLLKEQASYVRRERTPHADRYNKCQANLLQTSKDIGRTGNIECILVAEKSILENELQNYGNSSGMRTSLETALKDLKQAEKHIGLVQDPMRYEMVEELFQRDKNRPGGLPYDEGRQFFKSHSIRLLNQDRSRLTETEKKTIKARRSNIRVAEKAYIQLQQKALGITPKDQARDRGRSR